MRLVGVRFQRCNQYQKSEKTEKRKGYIKCICTHTYTCKKKRKGTVKCKDKTSKKNINPVKKSKIKNYKNIWEKCEV